MCNDDQDKRTIKVTGYFGSDKEIIKSDFVQLWVNHCRDLKNINWTESWIHEVEGIMKQVEKEVANRFEEIWLEQNPYIPMTAEQRTSIERKWNQDGQGISLDEFLKSVKGTIMMNDAVIVKWSGMWLAVETDGSVHS